MWVVKRRKDKGMILCKSNKEYIWLSLLVTLEQLINKLLFSSRMAMTDAGDINIFLMFLVFWFAFSLVLIIAISKAYKDVVHQERISQLNLSMLQKQYILFQEIYTEKRRQIHDSVQFDIMLMGFLKEGGIERAIHCLEEKLDQYSIKQKNRYTGIDVIDLMLTYKINEASQYDIAIQLNIDVFFCPVSETNMCIILGNLLDNAIDAVKDLKKEKRWIRIKMINPNSIFILEISNPYEGKRNKVEGHYVTTKLDKTMHGLGLDSVERIVNKVDGVMDIIDKDFIFTIVVTLFGKRRQNRNNMDTY